MRTTSLRERIEWLERELPPNPPRFRVYEDLPFAILRYDPSEEWETRREAVHLATRLRKRGIEVVDISLAEILWQAIDKVEGIAAIARLEEERGFEIAQEQVSVYLADPDFHYLPRILAERLEGLDPARHLCFLTRAASFAPAIYSISTLLEQMHGRTRVPTIVFYPGDLEGTNDLRFMGLKEREAPPTYRVKIYG